MTIHHHPVQFEAGPDNEIIVNVPNVRIKLTKNTKGYQWEISVADEEVSAALLMTEHADNWLRKHYGTTD
jgi:hypothetical protein